MTPLEWLSKNKACAESLEWLESSGLAGPEEIIAACERGDWLLWLADGLGYSAEQHEMAVRPAWLRAVRGYTPVALELAGLDDRAQVMRELKDDVRALTAESMAKVSEDTANKDLARYCDSRRERAWWAARAAKLAALAAKSASCICGPGMKRWASIDAAMYAAEAADGLGAKDAEHARCADEVRAALPDLAARWIAAMEVKR
jgi:hypothetical protein